MADHRRIGRRSPGQVVLVFDEFACGEVGSTEQHPVDVFVAPHHALRESGGTAGVQQVDVVGTARAEVAFGRAVGDRRVELDAAVALVRAGGHVGAVVDDQDRLHVGSVGQDIGDAFGVLPLVHQRDHVGVLEQVAQFTLDVAVVDVDQDRARLDDAHHRDDDLDAVAAVEADLVVLLHPLLLQVVREAVGLLLELGVGQLLLTADQRYTVGDGIDGVLRQIGNIQGHGP